jgi:hypothetical protein
MAESGNRPSVSDAPHTNSTVVGISELGKLNLLESVQLIPRFDQMASRNENNSVLGGCRISSKSTSNWRQKATRIGSFVDVSAIGARSTTGGNRASAHITFPVAACTINWDPPRKESPDPQSGFDPLTPNPESSRKNPGAGGFLDRIREGHWQR